MGGGGGGVHTPGEARSGEGFEFELVITLSKFHLLNESFLKCNMACPALPIPPVSLCPAQCHPALLCPAALPRPGRPTSVYFAPIKFVDWFVKDKEKVTMFQKWTVWTVESGRIASRLMYSGIVYRSHRGSLTPEPTKGLTVSNSRHVFFSYPLTQTQPLGAGAIERTHAVTQTSQAELSPKSPLSHLQIDPSHTGDVLMSKLHVYQGTLHQFHDKPCFRTQH